jgi:predicted lipoprotein
MATIAAQRSKPFWRRPAPIATALAVVVLAAMAATTTVVAADDPTAVAAAGGSTFNAVDYANERYDTEVVPAITENAVDIAELVPQIVADPEATGQKYGHKNGATAPYAYPVTGTGVAGQVKGTLLPVTIEGMPAGVQVMLQIGPAINGTALRDATGLIGFDDFLNQIEYANASTELNNKVKQEVLAGFDAAAAAGKTVTFTGAFAYGSNPAVLQVTPVELEVAP